jgi:hypothetical protein
MLTKQELSMIAEIKKTKVVNIKDIGHLVHLVEIVGRLQARVAELDARAFSPVAPAMPKKRTARGERGVIDPNHWQGKEGDFQRETEHVLTILGYTKRNKRGILDTLGKGGRKGWQVHIARAIGNPYVLDVLLFDRRSRRAQLTPAGAELLRAGEHLLLELDAVAQRVQRIATGWEAQLTIAADAADAANRIPS